MKVITLTAPWSWLAAARLKEFETRGWQTAYRGLLGIHTAQSLIPVGGPAWLLAFCARPWFREAMIAIGITDPLAEPRGCIIAVCNLAEIVPTRQIRGELEAMEIAFGDYSDGRYAWRLTGMNRLRTPITVRGAQGLWNWGDYAPPATARPELIGARP